MLDSHYTSVHFIHANQASFMEEWTDYAIAPNDIDTSRLFEATADMFPQLNADDDDDDALSQGAVFGSKVYRHRTLHPKKIWTDNNLDVLRADGHTNRPTSPKATSGSGGPTMRKLPDLQILHLLHQANTDLLDLSLNDFLSNGYNADTRYSEDALENVSADDLWLNTTAEYLANHTFSNMRMRGTSGSFQHGTYTAPGAQTPRMARRRPSQEKFQTPITRIR